MPFLNVLTPANSYAEVSTRPAALALAEVSGIVTVLSVPLTCPVVD